MAFSDIVLLSIVEIFGDFNLRWYAQTNVIYYLLYGVIGYTGVVFYLVKALRDGNVLYVNGMWDSMSTVMESIAAYIVLGDRLEKPRQYVGLMLVILGIYLLKQE